MVEGNLEQKQRVNLSSFARGVVEQDHQVFGGRKAFSGFLNRIIELFSPMAEASIEAAVEQRRQSLRGRVEPKVAAVLLEEYRQELLRKKEAWPQGDSLTFRLNNRNFEMLYEDRAESSSYEAPSKYLKALLEEYARLSPSDRERVYFSAQIEEVILPAVEAGYPLEVTVNGRAFTVRPYGVMADAYGAHMYLVGYSCPEGGQEQIASFRISRLEKLRLGKRSDRKRLTREEIRLLEKKLQKTGVQYLVGDVQQIRLRLTPTGQREFNQRSYMRPNPDSVSGGEYTFSCTQLQVRNYFLSFGAEVEILSPESLRQTFADAYRKALQVYE